MWIEGSEWGKGGGMGVRRVLLIMGKWMLLVMCACKRKGIDVLREHIFFSPFSSPLLFLSFVRWLFRETSACAHMIRLTNLHKGLFKSSACVLCASERDIYIFRVFLSFFLQACIIARI